METLIYSSDYLSSLNEARRSLWSSKYMRHSSIEEPGKYETPEFWDKVIYRDLHELRKVAHELRAKLPAKKAYYVTVAGEVITFSFWVRAHTRGQAMAEAKNRHPHFTLESVELLK